VESVKISGVNVAQKINICTWKMIVIDPNKRFVVEFYEHFSAMYATILTRIQTAQKQK